MWYLQGFDRKTELLVQDLRLPGLDPEAIRRILGIYDDLPVEPFGFDIPTPEAVRKLAAYAEETAVIDPQLWYQLGFYSD